MNLQKIISHVRPAKVQYVKMTAKHLLDMAAQDTHLAKYVNAQHALALEAQESFAVLRDGKPVACGGLIHHWPGRSEAWCHFAKDIGPWGFFAVHRLAKVVIREHPATRIEMPLDPRHIIEARWLRALGFHLEIPRMRAYFPGERDGCLYVRVR